MSQVNKSHAWFAIKGPVMVVENHFRENPSVIDYPLINGLQGVCGTVPSV